MNKKSAIISRIKNGIMSIISKLQNRNTEPGVTEEKEQPVDSEHISRSENKTESLSPDKKQLIDLKKELGESIDAILTKLFDGISGLLEDEYKDRLIGLERSIEELMKKKEEKVASAFKAYKEELEEVRNLAETAKLSSEENIGKIAKIATEELEIEKLEEKKEKRIEMKLSDIPDDKLKGILKEKEAPNVEDIENITKIGSIIEKMKQEGKDRLSEEVIEKIYLNKALITLISAKDREPPNLSLDNGKPLKESIADAIKKLDERKSNSMMPEELKELEKMSEELKELEKMSEELKELEKMSEELKELKIESLYKKGIVLLKRRAYQEAEESFKGITILNSELKGAWLNRGVAFGESCEIGDEIDCYNIALRIDGNYKKALHNKKIAERKMKRTK